MAFSRYIGNSGGSAIGGAAGLNGIATGINFQSGINANIRDAITTENFALQNMANREAQEQFRINQNNGFDFLQNRAMIAAYSPNAAVSDQNLLAFLANTAALTPIAQTAQAAGNSGPLNQLGGGANTLFNTDAFSNLGALNPMQSAGLGGVNLSQAYAFQQGQNLAMQLAAMQGGQQQQPQRPFNPVLDSGFFSNARQRQLGDQWDQPFWWQQTASTSTNDSGIQPLNTLKSLGGTNRLRG